MTKSKSQNEIDNAKRILISLVESSEDDVLIFYDGDCPVCRNYVKFQEFRKNFPRSSVLDARETQSSVRRALLTLNIDEGMIVVDRGLVYFGADAISFMAQVNLSGNVNPIIGLSNKLLSRKYLATKLYPLLVFGRNLLLFTLGKHSIDPDRKYSNHLLIKNSVLQLTRIWFGLVALIYFCNMNDFFALSPNYSQVILTKIAIASSLAVMLGYSRRFIYIFLWVFCLFYVGHRTVEHTLMSNITFWMIWVCPPGFRFGNPKSSVAAWFKSWSGSNIILFLPILNDAFYHFISGVSKLVDPTWVFGFGIYSVFTLDWIGSPIEFKSGLMPEVLNLVSMYGQLIILPCLLIKPFRLFGILATGIFFLSLIYPARLDLIGQLGFIYVLLALAFHVAHKIPLSKNEEKA